MHTVNNVHLRKYIHVKLSCLLIR